MNQFIEQAKSPKVARNLGLFHYHKSGSCRTLLKRVPRGRFDCVSEKSLNPKVRALSSFSSNGSNLTASCYTLLKRVPRTNPLPTSD